MTKQEVINAIQNIGGKVAREVEVMPFPINKDITPLPHSSFSVEYKGYDHELVVYYDKNGNVHKTTVSKPFGQEIKTKAQLP